jgi:hypothetical protein
LDGTIARDPASTRRLLHGSRREPRARRAVGLAQNVVDADAVEFDDPTARAIVRRRIFMMRWRV